MKVTVIQALIARLNLRCYGACGLELAVASYVMTQFVVFCIDLLLRHSATCGLGVNLLWISVLLTSISAVE